MSPRRGMGGPIIFEHVGNEVPSKKVATSLTFHIEKVFALWIHMGGELERENVV